MKHAPLQVPMERTRTIAGITVPNISGVLFLVSRSLKISFDNRVLLIVVEGSNMEVRTDVGFTLAAVPNRKEVIRIIIMLAV